MNKLIDNIKSYLFSDKSWENEHERAAANQVAAGDPTHALCNTPAPVDLPDSLETIEGINPADYVTYIVDGWSMYPEGINNGDILLCQEIKDSDKASLHQGKFVIIKVDEDYYHFRNKHSKYDVKLRKTVLKVTPGTSLEALQSTLMEVEDSILLKENQKMLKKKYKDTYDYYSPDNVEMMLSLTYDKGRLQYSFHPVANITYVARYVINKDTKQLTKL